MCEMDITLLRDMWSKYSYVPHALNGGGFKKWISKEDFYLDSYDNANKFTCFCRNESSLKESMATDAFRFLINALQTLSEVQEKTPCNKVSSWVIIQTYYAAFFSAHSILRLFGRPFVYLATGHTNIFKTRSELELGERKNFKNGNFLGIFNSNTRYIDFSFYDNSHAGLWKGFFDLCDWISRESLSLNTTQTNISIVYSYFDDLRRALTKNGSFEGGNWLSHFRNEVNYQFYEGAWFPFSRNEINFRDFARGIKRWRSNFISPLEAISSENDLEKFMKLSIVIIQIACYLGLDYMSLVDDKRGIIIQFDKFKNSMQKCSVF